MANGLLLYCSNPTGISDSSYNPNKYGAIMISDPAVVGLAGGGNWVLNTSGYAHNLNTYAGFLGATSLPALSGTRKFEMWGRVADVALTNAEGVRVIFNNRDLTYVDYWVVTVQWNTAALKYRLSIIEVNDGLGYERAFEMFPTVLNVPAYYHLIAYEQGDSIIAQCGMYELDNITDEEAISCAYTIGNRPSKEFTRFIFALDADPETDWSIRGCRISDMQWPVGTWANEEWIILSESSVGYGIRHWKVDPSGFTELGWLETPYPSYPGVFSNGTFVFMGTAAGPIVGQYEWNGSSLVRVHNADPGLLVTNAPKSYFIAPNNPGYLLMSGSADFGAGVQVCSFASNPTYSYGTPTSYAPSNHDWNRFFDFRVGAVGQPGYGNTFVCQPSSQGLHFESMTVSGTTITSHSSLTITGGGGGYAGHDRDTGLIVMTGATATLVYMAQMNMTTRALSAVGNGTIVGTNVYAVGACKGFVITYENGGMIRAYSRSGSTLTQVSSLSIGGSSSGGTFAVSPYTNYIYFIGPSNGQSRVMTISSTGILSTLFVIAGMTMAGGGSIAFPMAFLPAPLVTRVSTLRTNLVSWWSLNEANGTRLDSHGTNHLTVSGSVAVAAANFQKITLGGAADFSGGKLIKAAPHGLHSGDRNFTVAGWIWMDTKSANRTFACVATDAVTPGSQDWRLQYNAVSDRFRMYVNSSSGNWSATANTFGIPNTSNWYLLVAYHDNTNNLIGISVNGGAFETGTGPTTNNNIGAEFALGMAGSSEPHDGKMDEFAFWDRLLTASEVAQLYNNGSGIPYPKAA